MTWLVTIAVFLSLPVLAAFVAGMVWREQVHRWLWAKKPKRKKPLIEAVE